VISPRWSKIRRDIWRYKARAGVVVLAIAVGIMAFGLISTVQVIVAEKYTDTYQASRAAHAVMMLPTFDDRLLAEVKTVPGVAQAEARQVVIGKIELSPGYWTALELQAIPDFEQVHINRLTVEQGARATPRDGTIFIETSALSLANLRLDDQVTVRLVGGQAQSLPVSGIVNDPNQIPSSIRPTVYGYATVGTLRALGTTGGYNRLYVEAAGNPQTREPIERLVTDISQRITSLGGIVLGAFIPEPGKPVLQDSLQTILIILSVTGFISLVLSGFLITNIMAALIAQQTRQIGVIKAIGGLPTQIVGLYLVMVLILGLVALVLAVPASMVGAYLLAGFIGRQMNFRVTGVYLPLHVLIIQVLGATAVPVFGALIPVLRGARITVREAISSAGTSGQAGRGLFERILLRLENLSVPTILPIRNVFRRKMRLFFTLTALSLGGATFIAVLATREAMQSAARQIQAERDYDFEIDFEGRYDAAQVEQETRKVAAVTETESWPLTFARRVFQDGRESGSVYVIGVPATSEMVHPFIRQGRWLAPEDHNTLFVNAEAMAALGQDAFQQAITLKIGNSQRVFRVVGVSSRLLVPIAYTRADDLISTAGSWPVGHRLVVKTTQRDPSFVSAIQTDVLDRLERSGLTITASQTLTDIKNAGQAQIDNVVTTLWSMAGLIALVGVLGLSSTMGLNVFERTREIGVLRALGASSRIIRQLVIGESISIAVISCLFAAALSIPISTAFADTLGMSLLLRHLDLTFSTLGLLLWIVMVVAAAIIASLIPAQNAANLTVRETLAYEG
jgi:putative ABC transport system permease protein